MLSVMSDKTFLALAAALGYGVSTILMKHYSQGFAWLPLALLVAVLAGTVVSEVLLLRQVELGLAYIAIIATESLLVLGYSFAIGEGLSRQETAGAVFVLFGVVLVSF